MLVIGRLKFQGLSIASNEALLRCFLFREWQCICKKKKLCCAAFCFDSQNEVYLWSKAIKKKKAELFVWIMLIILLSEVLAVIFLQKRRLIKLCITRKIVGKLAVTNKYQYVHAIFLDQEGLSSAISNSYNNGQFHYAISHLK